MPKTEPPRTPECNKLIVVSAVSQEIGRFLDWLEQDKHVCFSKRADELYTPEVRAECGLRADDMLNVGLQRERTLAEYFKIDLKKVEEERRAILEWTRMEREEA